VNHLVGDVVEARHRQEQADRHRDQHNQRDQAVAQIAGRLGVVEAQSVGLGAGLCVRRHDTIPVILRA